MKYINNAGLSSYIESHVRSHPDENLASVSQALLQELRRLAESGLLSLDADKNLTGESLEVRVFLLLSTMGFNAVRGRKGHEDFVVTPQAEADPARPLVIEVKSGRKPSVQRDDLRQLDDWVFDLSQEEVARKNGLGGGIDELAMITDGLLSSTYYHPSPHKGVLIFNAPVGVPFDERLSPPLEPDELAFAHKRNFCIIPIDVLIALAEAIKQGSKNPLDVWREIHDTCGMMK